MLNLPNAITVARTILVPVIFWLVLAGHIQAAFFAFLAAGISDALDGLIARRFGLQTELGAYLDPLADKMLIIAIFVALGFRGDLPLWLVVAVVSRDILILLALIVASLLGKPMKISPLAVGKATTAAQIVLAAAVLANVGFALNLDPQVTAVVWVTAALTIASLAVYLREWLLHMSRE